MGVFAVVSLWKSENNFWGGGVSSLGIELRSSGIVPCLCPLNQLVGLSFLC